MRISKKNYLLKKRNESILYICELKTHIQQINPQANMQRHVHN